MGRAILQAKIEDRSGNAIENARVHVYQHGTTTYVTDLFAALTGGAAITPAILTTSARGRIEGFLDTARLVTLVADDNGNEAHYSGAVDALTFSDLTQTAVAVTTP